MCWGRCSTNLCGRVLRTVICAEGRFFVPLHQRIRLRRLNRKNLSRADIWKQDTTSDEMGRLFSNGQKLSPEVMEALAAAGELSGIASRAKTRSNDLPSWNGDDSTDNGDKESNESPTTRPLAPGGTGVVFRQIKVAPVIFSRLTIVCKLIS